MPQQIHRRFADDSPNQRLESLPGHTAKNVESVNISRKRKREHSIAIHTIKQSGAESWLGENVTVDGVAAHAPDSTEILRPSTHNATSIYRKEGRTVQTDPSTGHSVSLVQSKPSRAVTPEGTRKPEHNYVTLKEKAKVLEPIRRSLPIWAHADEIRNGLRQKDVMLLVGETGSGKSTQVPQFLVHEAWCRPQWIKGSDGKANKSTKVGGCIAITEPRRVAAITLARRVAEEMGTPLGSSSPASKVGYSVRFDNSTSPCTRIKFLTEGMLLQEMLRDPWLPEYSAVIVDEVHERGMNVDLIMGFLRNIVTGKKGGRGGVPLKVAIMSATADTEALRQFFEDGFTASKPQQTVLQNASSEKDNTTNGYDSDSDGSEWSGILDDDEALTTTSYRRKPEGPHTNGIANSTMKVHTADILTSEGGESNSEMRKAIANLSNIYTCYIEGRQHPVKILYSPEPVQDYVDAALRTVIQIHYKEPLPGDILVFLTGQETVESLEALLKDHALGLGPEVPRLSILPLFAALPQAAQQRVFQPASFRTRKVILATNIAETSVTVSGVRFVVDCGKSKIKQFRTRLGLDSLLVKPISKSAAIQRKGRAGREAPGQCYRLYTEQDYLKLDKANTPEILRCDLTQGILTMKARGVKDILAFPFLDRPPRVALERALMHLFQIGALTETGEINKLGTQIAQLPLTASLGRVLLAAAEPEMDCLSEVIDIISCLSVENIFLNLTSEEKKEEAESARRGLYRREGDHLTLLATIQAYLAERSDRKVWAEKHFVSHRAMQAVTVSL